MVDAGAGTGTQVHAFALLPSRVLILCTPAAANGISGFMQAIGRRYTAVFNAKHHRSGALWNGRFKAAHVDPDTHLETAIRFVATVAAYLELAVAPADYQWADYPCRRAVSVLSVADPNGDSVSWDARSDQRTRYERCLSTATYEDIERALRHELAIGSSAFKARLAFEHGIRVHLGRPGRPRKYGDVKRLADTLVGNRRKVERLAAVHP